MEYRIILIKNMKQKKVLYSCRTSETATVKYEAYLENNNVMFPKKHTNYRHINLAEYKIALVKEKEDSDKELVVRNDLGKLVSAKSSVGKWTILDVQPYEIEETFYVFGYDYVHDRFTIADIVRNILFKNTQRHHNIKEIIAVYNKLIIMDNYGTDLIICKCREDANRLHNALRDSARKNKLLKKLIFLGTAKNPMVIRSMYEEIQDLTGWTMKKIRKNSTHP